MNEVIDSNSFSLYQSLLEFVDEEEAKKIALNHQINENEYGETYFE